MKRSHVIGMLFGVIASLSVFVYLPLMQRVTTAVHLQQQQQVLEEESTESTIDSSSLHQSHRKEKAAGHEEAQTKPPVPLKQELGPPDKEEKDFNVNEFRSQTTLASTVYDPSAELLEANKPVLHRTKIVGFITNSYAKIAMRWYSRLQALGYRNQYIVCTEPAVYYMLRNFSKTFLNQTITYERVEASFMPELPPEWSSLKYGKKQRRKVKRLFAYRWVYLLEQLKAGYHVLLTDVDNIFSRYYPMEELEGSEYDVHHALETKHPTDVYDYQGFVFCGGMGWYRSSAPTIRFIQEMVDRCQVECDDQVLLNRIIAYVLNIDWNYDTNIIEQHDATSNNNQTMTIRTADTSVQTRRVRGHVLDDHFERIVGLVTTGFTGYSNSTGLRINVWDRDFAYRGKNDPTDCPSSNDNWVSMPFVIFTSRFQGPHAKLVSYDIWDRACPNYFSNLSVSQHLPGTKYYKKLDVS